MAYLMYSVFFVMVAKKSGGKRLRPPKQVYSNKWMNYLCGSGAAVGLEMKLFGLK
ncbi:hypothetical protein [Rugamonas rubra]|uniref:hypothetical protein n=1 Tax=Rugamonas rubra TaxID=758825 RepID=UPI001583FF7D|nr:hypothetical protein [Rugamonas rubra]